MTRPTYETAETLAEEHRSAQAIAERWRCGIVKLPRSYRLDYALIRDGKVEAWLEIKRRSRKYPALMISAAKIAEALRLEQATGRPAFLAVAWPDGLYYVRIRGEHLTEITIGSRIDRGDSEDVEPVAMIPAEQFRQIA